MKKLFPILVSFLLLFSFVGCGKVDRIIDTNKTQIYVTTFAGGLGDSWLREVADRYNAKSDTYQVLVADPNKDQYDVIRPQIETGVSRYDIFFNTNSDYVELAMGGYLESLNGVLASKPDGDQGMTVKDKMKDQGDLLDPFTIEDETYALPFTDLTYGFVYDHELFVQKGWLFQEEDGSVSAGRDGKKGTYDDGLPVTMQEFDVLLATIFGDGVTPLNWSGLHTGYLTEFCNAIQAQYDGLDNFILSYSYDGTYRPRTGESFEITPKTGYKHYDMAGTLKSLEFLKKYFIDATTYRTRKSELLTTSHTEAQNNFIMSAISDTYERCAIHCDGEWWENEARNTFNALEREQHSGYAYGVHDYRFMPIPNYEDAYGTDGQGGGVIAPILENGNVFAKKQKDEKKRAGVMDFLSYTCSDEALRIFTVSTGTLRPFKYTMTEEDKTKMSKFALNVMEFKQDPNVKFVRPKLYKYKSPLNYRIESVPYHYQGKINTVYYSSPFMAMDPTVGAGATPQEFLNAIKADMSKDAWEKMYGSYYKD